MSQPTDLQPATPTCPHAATQADSDSPFESLIYQLVSAALADGHLENTPSPSIPESVSWQACRAYLDHCRATRTPAIVINAADAIQVVYSVQPRSLTPVSATRVQALAEFFFLVPHSSSISWEMSCVLEPLTNSDGSHQIADHATRHTLPQLTILVEQLKSILHDPKSYLPDQDEPEAPV